MKKHSVRTFLISLAALLVFAAAAIAVAAAAAKEAADDALIQLTDFIESGCERAFARADRADRVRRRGRIQGHFCRDGRDRDSRQRLRRGENHISRPEIADALESGEGFAERRSETLGVTMTYYARLTDIPEYGRS